MLRGNSKLEVGRYRSWSVLDEAIAGGPGKVAFNRALGTTTVDTGMGQLGPCPQGTRSGWNRRVHLIATM